jgi:hypothetical protein
MNTNTTSSNVVDMVSEAVSCVRFSNDMRKSYEWSGKERQIAAALESAHEALEYIRRAQELLDQMVDDINSKYN